MGLFDGKGNKRFNIGKVCNWPRIKFSVRQKFLKKEKKWRVARVVAESPPKPWRRRE